MAGTLPVVASTIYGNSLSSAIGAGSGGGIFNFGDTVTIINFPQNSKLHSSPLKAAPPRASCWWSSTCQQELRTQWLNDLIRAQ